MRIISEGKARCIKEPRGDYKLEGYNLNDDYKFQQCDKDKNGKAYIRVFPSDDFYETCSTSTFSKYFKITEEQSIKSIIK